MGGNNFFSGIHTDQGYAQGKYKVHTNVPAGFF